MLAPSAPSAHKTCRPQQPGSRNGTPSRRVSVRQAGRIWAAGNGIKVSDRRRLPAELLLTFMAATGRQLRGKEPRLGLQYALIPNSGRRGLVYLCIGLHATNVEAIVNSPSSFVSETCRLGAAWIEPHVLVGRTQISRL